METYALCNRRRLQISGLLNYLDTQHLTIKKNTFSLFSYKVQKQEWTEATFQMQNMTDCIELLRCKKNTTWRLDRVIQLVNKLQMFKRSSKAEKVLCELSMISRFEHFDAESISPLLAPFTLQYPQRRDVKLSLHHAPHGAHFHLKWTRPVKPILSVSVKEFNCLHVQHLIPKISQYEKKKPIVNITSQFSYII